MAEREVDIPATAFGFYDYYQEKRY
jgi:hypothetical protein